MPWSYYHAQFLAGRERQNAVVEGGADASCSLSGRGGIGKGFVWCRFRIFGRRGLSHCGGGQIGKGVGLVSPDRKSDE